MAATSIYYQLLTAVRDRLQLLPTWAGPPGPRPRFAIRKKPQYVPAQDALPGVIIACDEKLTERVKELTFEKGAHLEFEVYVGIVTLASWDEIFLEWRLARREDIRLTLWEPGVIGIATDISASQLYDVDYDPNPQVPRADEKTVDESWQKFTFTVATARSK